MLRRNCQQQINSLQTFLFEEKQQITKKSGSESFTWQLVCPPPLTPLPLTPLDPLGPQACGGDPKTPFTAYPCPFTPGLPGASGRWWGP